MKQSAENAGLYREILNRSIDAIFIADLDGRFIEQNAAHRTLRADRRYFHRPQGDDEPDAPSVSTMRAVHEKFRQNRGRSVTGLSD